MSNPKHYYLIAGEVVTSKEGIERSKALNAMVATEKGYFSRKDLAAAQQSLMQQFVTRCKQIKGAEIVNVHIQAVSFFGIMTEEEFMAGFVDPVLAETLKSKQGLN
ncbi:hypothetical protein [Mesorhizobium sp. CN2-181]|uniref:hypothetical protein n=1 Tax=Mesorhizobium yinganensis TaxID=3157707 RepID=UPI0032B87C3E